MTPPEIRQLAEEAYPGLQVSPSLAESLAHRSGGNPSQALGILGRLEQEGALRREGSDWLLEEGIALRASDIDMVYLTGYGFPPYRGGPMFYADTVGLDRVLQSIQSFQQGYQGSQWQPAPVLAKLAREGKRFNP